MAPSSTPQEIADKAVALATGNDGNHTGDSATLIKLAGDEGSLVQARELLVRRIRRRSDDFPATSGLSLLNAAISKQGWKDDVEWQPRKWRIPH